VTAARKRMKSVVAVLVILLLAAAGAAGAGDDIKWKRSKGLEYHSPETNPLSYGDVQRELVKKCAMEWTASTWGADVAQMVVVYVDWGLFYGNYRSLTEKRRWKEVDVDSWREAFGQNYYFLAAISARDKPESRLSNRTVWEVVVEIDGREVAPDKVRPVEGGDFETTQTITYIGAPSLSNKFRYFTSIYVVEIAKPDPNAIPRNLKLMILGNECRRGFEWRFEEE
jgi:hypothetical protein